MNCDFQPQPDAAHKSGRCVGKCRRCGRIGLEPPSGKWERLNRECLAWPMGWEIGHWITLWLEVFGLSKRRWNWIRRKLGFTKPCGCDKREADWNTAGQKLRDGLNTTWERIRGIFAAKEL